MSAPTLPPPARLAATAADSTGSAVALVGRHVKFCFCCDLGDLFLRPYQHRVDQPGARGVHGSGQRILAARVDNCSWQRGRAFAASQHLFERNFYVSH